MILFIMLAMFCLTVGGGFIIINSEDDDHNPYSWLTTIGLLLMFSYGIFLSLAVKDANKTIPQEDDFKIEYIYKKTNNSYKLVDTIYLLKD